jgi:hypothetical protein
VEEHYQNTLIRVTVNQTDGKLRWTFSCKITFTKGGRQVQQDLDLPLDYSTPEQAERAGMVFSKKWVDAGMPNPLKH